MQRLLAIVVGFAFAGTAADVSTLHTHAYIEHDHPVHHHGPAAHKHSPAPAHQDQDDDAPHLESCDPGQHAVSVTIFCPPLPRVDAIDTAFANVVSLKPMVLLRSAHILTEVRVHGPPPLTQVPPRAPPSIYPA